jgi:broad specificity phosphatase PhoE
MAPPAPQPLPEPVPKPVQRLLLLRHGESTWNVEHRWQGWLDPPLTPAGVGQAAARARALAHDSFAPRAIYTSDLQRAVRTAEIIAAHVESPVMTDAGFRERFGGDWQGCTGAEIDERWPGMRAKWRRGEMSAPPGGEEDTDALARFDGALTGVLAHVGTGVGCIVTHHGILRLVATRAGVDVHAVIPNVGGFWFDVVGGRLVNAEPLE